MARTTSEQILNAARDLFVKQGLRRTSLDDIAAAAGIGRATLFRRYTNRDTLITALIDQELAAALAKIEARTDGHTNAKEAFIAGFLAFIDLVRTNDLLRELVQSDPDTVLPVLTVAGQDAIAIGTSFALDRLQPIAEQGIPLTASPHHLAEMLARIGHSLALTPQTILPIEDDDAMAEFARNSLIPMVFK